MGQAWREPRTILIGLVMLGFGFTEGTANDWPLIGVLAQRLGVLNAILCVLAALLIGLLASGAAKPLPIAGP